MVENLYDILGVKKDATSEEIKDAYRDKAKELHPDAQTENSDNEKMAALNNAYSILSNPEKRKKYDETGQNEFQPRTKERFADIVSGVFISIIEQSTDLNHSDVIKEFRLSILHIIDNNQQQRRQVTNTISRFEN